MSEVRLGAVGRHALRGMVWMLAQNAVGRVCGMLSQLALAALLTPDDFGVVGLAYAVTAVAGTLTNIGIEDVLLRRGRALRLWVGPALGISFGLALAAAALVVAVAPFAARLYDLPRLTGLLATSALGIPFGALSVVPLTIVRARMRFDTLALYGTGDVVLQAVLAVAFAMIGLGAYSFVLPATIMAAVRAVVWWRLSGTSLRTRLHLRQWRYLVGNTAVVFATRGLATLIGQGDYIVLGLLANPAVVGQYYFGFRLAAQPLSMLAANVISVLYPALAGFKSDPDRQGKAAVDATRFLFFAIMPVAALQAAVAAPLVTWLFGPKWAASIPIIQILSIGLALDAPNWTAATLMNARGEFKANLRYIAVEAPLFFGLVIAGGFLDEAIGVAWAVLAFYAAKPIFVYMAFRRIGITPQDFASIYIKPMIFAGTAMGIGWAGAASPFLATLPLAQVAVIASLGCGLYGFALKYLASDVWNQLYERVVAALRRKVAAPS